MVSFCCLKIEEKCPSYLGAKEEDFLRKTAYIGFETDYLV